MVPRRPHAADISAGVLTHARTPASARDHPRGEHTVHVECPVIAVADGRITLEQPEPGWRTTATARLTAVSAELCHSRPHRAAVGWVSTRAREGRCETAAIVSLLSLATEGVPEWKGTQHDGSIKPAEPHALRSARAWRTD
jgi:hypothetical protein